MFFGIICYLCFKIMFKIMYYLSKKKKYYILFCKDYYLKCGVLCVCG